MLPAWDAASPGRTLLLEAGQCRVSLAELSTFPGHFSGGQGAGTCLGPCRAAVGKAALGLSVAFAEHVPVPGLACPDRSSSTIQIGQKI